MVGNTIWFSICACVRGSSATGDTAPMPPVFGPLSSSNTALWSRAGSNGTIVWPSVKVVTDSSWPTRNSSSTIVLPAAPNRPFSRQSVTATCAWSLLFATVTPLPAARPDALTTIGPSSRMSRNARALAASSNVQCDGEGMRCRRHSSRANALLPSSSAALRLGPKHGRLLFCSSSTRPATSGPSGPTTTRSIVFSTAKLRSPAVSSAEISTLSASSALPALPGAQYSRVSNGDCLSLWHSACSRPPPPTTRTFIAGHHTERTPSAEPQTAGRSRPSRRSHRRIRGGHGPAAAAGRKSPHMTFAGDLQGMSLADVFQTVAQNRTSGTLHVVWPKGERLVRFTDGKISALAFGSTPGPLLLDHVIERGMVTAPALPALKKRLQRSKVGAGRVMVAAEIVTAEQLPQVLSEMVAENSYDLLSLKDARFTFKDGPEPDGTFDPDQLAADIHHEVGPLLLEGARRADDWQRIRAVIGSDQDLFLAEGGGGAAPATDVAAALLPHLDGRTDLPQLCAHVGKSRFEVAAALAALVQQGLARPARAEEISSFATQL